MEETVKINEDDLTLLKDTRKKDEYTSAEINKIKECVEKIKKIGELITQKNDNISYRLAGNIPFNFKNHVHNIWIKIWYNDFAYCKERIFYTLGLFIPERSENYALLLRLDYKHTGSYKPSNEVNNKREKCEKSWENFTGKTLSEIAQDALGEINNWKENFAKVALTVDTEVLINDITFKLLDKHNIILTGAPGTGKTYLAKKIADSMNAESKFVQFHPSYDYTDFVEGLRSYDNGGVIGFRRQDGVFKKFCKKALEAWQLQWKSNEETWKINNSKSEDYILTNEEKKEIRKTTLESTELKKYVFIIDEINRGELSKIFGELFYSIDPGYRGEEGMVQTQYQNLVDYERDSNGKMLKKDGTENETTENPSEAIPDIFQTGFYVPENVYIIGTMNDIDRSVEPMDFAVRRRFVWIDIKPEDRIAMWGNAVWKEQAETKMHNINAVIRSIEALGEPYCIGPAYFNNPPLDRNLIDDELWTLRIEPILREYVRVLPKDQAKDYLDTFKAAYNADEKTIKTDYDDLKKYFAKKENE